MTTLCKPGPQALAAAVLLTLSAGCVAPQPSTGLTHADRLKAAYPDLAAGRFLIIADFETPTHQEIVELVNASGEAAIAPDPSRGRTETGGRALRFTAGSPSDALVLANRAGADWYLTRDWHAYDLLLMSVHAPSEGLSAVMTVAGGTSGDRTAASTTAALQDGWNTLRLDLAELGEQVPIDDVQEIRLSIAGQRRPVTVVLDDVLLTGSRETLFGDPGGFNGRLYVQRVGKQWNIGAGGRFEITILNGQIRRWYNLAADPHRIRNLLAGTSLGPMPSAIDATGRFAPLTASGSGVHPRVPVAVEQRLVEMNAVRIVVEILWQVLSADDPIQLYRWNHVIYPSGQVFTRVEAVARTGAAWPAPLGAVVSMAAPGSDVTADVGPSGVADGKPDCTRYGYAEHAPARARLAVLPLRACESGDLTVHTDTDRREVSFVLRGEERSGPVAAWTLQLSLADRDADDAPGSSKEELTARALDYTTPAPIEVLKGTVSDRRGLREDGFDPASGAFVVRPANGRIRVRLNGRERTLFSPGFVIEDTADHDVWVYVNHVIHDETARDAGGNVVFRIPRPVRQTTIVEAVVRPRGDLPTP